jgi:DNA topoisomerase-1
MAEDSSNDLNPCKDYVRRDKAWFLGDKEIAGDELERLNKMRLPPAWTDVVASTDPNSKVQAIGKDAAGRWQYRYSAEHIAQAAREKFDRLKSFANDIPEIRQGMAAAITKDDPRAWLLHFEDQTAIRVGSEKDFKAKVKAYGLTTLQNEHVTLDGSKIILDFIAKEGKKAHYEFVDDELAGFLKKRLERTTIGEQLFPDVTASTLNKFLKELAGGKDYSIKDFRTFHGTRIAYEELKDYAGVVLNDKEKKKLVKEVCTKVSDFLHNTPAMAKNSYIDPMVWDFIGGI